jgi:hypothetical protein
MSSLHSNFAALPCGHGLSIRIAAFSFGAASVTLSLRIIRLPGGLCAQLKAFHTDPEGSFSETLDASRILDCQDLEALDAELNHLVFPSGIRGAITTWDDLTLVMPEFIA